MLSRFFIAILDGGVRWYQKAISPLFGPTCKYSPTCSSYARQAWKIHGLFKGTLLSVWRLLRCNPWSKGGVDRVPEKGAWPAPPLDYDALMELYAREDACQVSHHTLMNEQDV